MSYSGQFSTPNRTGSSANTTLELIYNALLAARGTAYSNANSGTVVAAETFGYAKAIVEIFNSNERMGNQWNPNSMGPFISRWEAIFGISPSPTASIKSRKNAIAAVFASWSQKAIIQITADIIKSILGNIFIKVEYYKDSDNLGSVHTGGAVIPGGSTYTSNTWGGLIPNGVWMSYVNQIIIEVWQPMDHNGNKIISDQDFQNTIKNASAFLQRWLPCYTDFIYYQRSQKVSGTVTMSLNSTAVVGSGTSFLTEFVAGNEFSSIDDAGNYQEYKILNVINNTFLNLATVSPSNNTTGIILYEGFFLDSSQLDVQSIGSISLIKP